MYARLIRLISLLVLPASSSGFTHLADSVGLLFVLAFLFISSGVSGLYECEESSLVRGGGATAHSRKGDLGSTIV